MGPQGATVNKVDASGRIALREHQLNELEDSVVLTLGFSGNLVMFTPEQWPELVKQFDSDSPLDPDANELRRGFIGAAVRVELDDRGRLKIPEALRAAAGLSPGKSRATILNLETNWEIWEQNTYINYMAENRGRLKDLARERFGTVGNLVESSNAEEQ